MSNDGALRDRGYVNNEETFRTLLAGQASTDSRLDEVFRVVREAQTDAREARDQAARLATLLEAQNFKGEVADLRTEMRSLVKDLGADVETRIGGLRQDMVRNITDLKTDQKAHGERLDALETARSKVVGIADFFAWLAKVAPWAVAALGAYFAGLKAHSG